MNSHHVLNGFFQRVPQVPNVFLKMLPIAHHTLYHIFCPKLNKLYNIVGPKGGMSTNHVLEVQTSIVGGGCSNFKVLHILFVFN